ncbi:MULTISPECIES: alpha/beta hydrolase [Planktothricoides]|uniref:Alpha/beta hydrolase n=2 Tax=Planktothricoides raciborskii TaxID=132608 RepID=A0ABR8ECG2_9CYAN|nr:MULTISPECIES: alpha/beta hydrolase [Planktothricoides]MBD2544270.1 alpha/beta hydrolase [Planktothricoides raciborskii FACHB-1370]MBD2583622.1 alpha/beta hydrolase [Planktothricoides raciborskii FACHB-1261]
MKFPFSFLKRVANKLRNLPQRLYKFVALGMAVCLVTTSLVFIQSPQTVAQTVVQQVTLTYGPQKLTIPMSELETFAETGEASKVIRFISGFVSDDTEMFRTALTQKVTAPSPMFLNQAMDFIVGELFLFEIGQVIHTPSRKNVIEALRSSIGLSVLDDRQVSLLEVIEKYPAQELFIDAKKLNQASKYITFLVNGAEKGLMFVRETLGDLIC